MIIYDFTWDDQGSDAAYVLDQDERVRCIEAKVLSVPRRAIGLTAWGLRFVNWDLATFERYQMASDIKPWRAKRALVVAAQLTGPVKILEGNDAVRHVALLAKLEETAKIYCVNRDQVKKAQFFGHDYVTSWGGER